jgi:hypothetical protein
MSSNQSECTYKYPEYHVYIGWDESDMKDGRTTGPQTVAYNMCKRSMEANTNANVVIHRLNRPKFRKDGIFWRTDDTSGATGFTYTRYLVPYLNNYQGFAVFCDSDFVWDADVAKMVDKYADSNYAVSCVQHTYDHLKESSKMNGIKNEWYPKKNWSSMMIFNCEHPATKHLTLDIVNTQTPKYLHRFEWLDGDHQIKNVSHRYNYLVEYYHDHKALLAESSEIVFHHTNGTISHPGYEFCEHHERCKKYVTDEEIKMLVKDYGLNYETGSERLYYKN